MDAVSHSTGAVGRIRINVEQASRSEYERGIPNALPGSGMGVSKSQRLKLLLEKGYLPEDLPPPFNARGLAKYAEHFSKCWAGKKTPLTRYQRYSTPRLSNSRRVLAITNPVSQFNLSKIISDNYVEIKKIISKSCMSIAVPEIISDEIRAIRPVEFEKLYFKRLQISSCHSVVLQSDISWFYPTLYTHVIPWALHGKEWCKSSLQSPDYKKSLGKMLDNAIRFTQENQTIGIPIGPDTSRIISEIVAVAVEEKLLKETSLAAGVAIRHVDDITIGFDSLSDAEEGKFALEKCLDYYELQVNYGKTKTSTSADYRDGIWVYQIKQFSFGDTAPTQRRSLEHFIHLAFDLALSNPSDNVLNYAVKATKGVDFFAQNWDLYETFLLKCGRSNGTCVPPVAQLLIWYNHRSVVTEKARIAKYITDMLARHAPIGHHAEVAWCLFLAKALRIEIQKKDISPVYDIDCSICSLISLDLDERGLISGGLDKTKWEKLLTVDNLDSESWLLVYEGAVKGWLGSNDAFIDGHKHFKDLKRKKVSFYDEGKNVKSKRAEKYAFLKFYENLMKSLESVSS